MSDSFLVKIGILIALLTTPSWLQAWPTPVDMDADNIGSNNTNNTYTTSDGTTYDRCDASDYSGTSGGAPPDCHRWGLVFQYHSNPSSWEPKIPSDDDGNEYRLPTIKELVRLFDYTGDFSGADAGTGLDDVIESWLPSVSTTTWLISSSYRDIDRNYDGSDDSEFAQVFALNVSTGEVKALKPDNLEICNSLKSGTGSGSNSSNDRGRCASSTSGQTVYAIKVNQTLLKDM